MLSGVAGAGTFLDAVEELGLGSFVFFFIFNNGEPSAQAAKKGRNLPNEVILRPAVKPAQGAITELDGTPDPMLKDGLYK